MVHLSSKQSTTRLNFTITSAHGNVTPEAQLAINLTSSFDSATGIYQISDTITCGVDTIDLVGSLVDDLGDAVKFKKVHLLHYNSTSASSNAMTFGDNFGMTSAISLAGGAYSTYINEAGQQITATSGDTITVTGTTGSPYDVVVVGLKL